MSVVLIRDGKSSEELRRLAWQKTDVCVVAWLLDLTNALEGMSWERVTRDEQFLRPRGEFEGAKISMRQTRTGARRVDPQHLRRTRTPQ